jgi:uncharacterized protein (DUF697 family)
MRKLMLAIFGSALVAAASAQSPSPTPAATPDEARAARQKASPENVKKATAGTEKGYTRAAGEAAEKAAASKDMPKVTPDNASKQQAVKSATAGTAKGYTQAAGDAAAKAKNDKTPRVKAPKPQAGTPELNKLVP